MRRNNEPLPGKRILVTGASSGIGLVCARELSAEGVRLALVSRGGDALAEAAAALQPTPATFTADVTNAAQLVQATGEAATALGGLDAVVANAGAATYGPFIDMTPDDYGRTIDTTLVGILNTAHAALPHLTASSGTLVVVGSIAGRVPVPWLASYAAAKHGVRGFVRSLRAELRALGNPVQVALIAPGPVDTPFWKRARTTDGRLPPEIRGAYSPEAVAAEVLRALRDPRAERTVGATMAAVAFLDAMAPNLSLRLTAPLAKLGWRNRGQRPASPPDGLARPAEEARAEGDLASRPSIAGKVRDAMGSRRD